MRVDRDAPFFSVVLPAYNAEKTLGRAVGSVLSQTFKDFELIIVDDGSTDATLALALEYEKTDPRIAVVHQEHTGCAAARGQAASHAHGEYIVKFDADDEMEPFALTELESFIDREPGYDIYSGTADKILPNGDRAPFFLDPRFDLELSLTLSDLLDECYIFGGCATIKRSTLEDIGGFRPNVYCEDYDVWLRSLAAGATHRYMPVSFYRYHFGTEGHMNEDPTRSLESFIEIFSDLIASGVLNGEDEEHACRSIKRFEALRDQYREAGVTEAVFTQRQARVFYEKSEKLLGPRGARVVMRVAQRVKWVARPFRLMLAKRAYREERRR